MNEEPEEAAPKYKEGDTVYTGDEEWVVDSVNTYFDIVTYDIKSDPATWYDTGKIQRNVPAERVHHLSLSARLARIEAALNLT